MIGRSDHVGVDQVDGLSDSLANAAADAAAALAAANAAQTTADDAQTAADAAQASADAAQTTADQAAPAGTIHMYGGAAAPTGYLICDGSSVLRATYPALFAAIGTAYGSVDGTHFNLPNFSSKFPRGNTPGASGGASTKVLTVGNLPPHIHDIGHDHTDATTSSDGAHRHSINESSASGSGSNLVRGTNTTSNTGNAPVVSDGAHTHTVNIPAFSGDSGSGSANGLNSDPVDIMNPWLGVTFIIKI